MAVALSAVVAPLLLVPSASAAEIQNVIVGLGGFSAPEGSLVTVSLCARDCIDRSENGQMRVIPELTGAEGRPLQQTEPIGDFGALEAVFPSVPEGKWWVHVTSIPSRPSGYLSTKMSMLDTEFSQAETLEIGGPGRTTGIWMGVNDKFLDELVDPLEELDRVAGEDWSSASYLDRVYRGYRKNFMKWRNYGVGVDDVNYRAQIEGREPGRVSFSNGVVFRIGTVSKYPAGTRFILSTHWCDGTVQAAMTKVGDGRPMDLEVGADSRGHWRPAYGPDVYTQVTVLKDGWRPNVTRDWDDAACRRTKKATELVDRWGEKRAWPTYTGERASVAAPRVTPGVKVSHTWFAGKRKLKATGRALTVPHSVRGKRLRVVVKATRGTVSHSHTFVYGTMHDGRGRRR